MSIPNLNNGHKTFYENHNVQLEPSEVDQKVSDSSQPILASSTIAEAAKHNQANSRLLQLPLEISLQILGQIDSPTDIVNVNLACKQLRSDMAEAQIQWMRKMVAAAREWDKQIKALSSELSVVSGEENSSDDDHVEDSGPSIESMGSPGILADPKAKLSNSGYSHSKFDPQRHLTLLEQGSRSAAEIAKEMRLDLVEALSEYADCKKKEIRFLSQLEVPQEPALAEILAEAKRTVKGDVFLSPDLAQSVEQKPNKPTHRIHVTAQRRYVRPMGSKSSAVGPFVDCWYANDANENWVDHSYKATQALGLKHGRTHVDFFIGKREGDRVVIPRTEGRQIILRLHQQRYRYDRLGGFEQALQKVLQRCEFLPQRFSDCEAAWRSAQERICQAYRSEK